MFDCETIGAMVREITFQSELTEKGMTGWILSVKRSPSRREPMRPS